MTVLLDRDDLAQERAIGRLLAARNYDPAKGTNFDVHLAVGGRRAVLDALRAADPLTRSDRRRFKQGDDIPAGKAPVEFRPDVHDTHYEIDVDARIDLGRVLPALSPREKDLVVSLYWEEATSVSVARRWGVTGAAVSHAHARLLAKLRELLA